MNSSGGNTKDNISAERVVHLSLVRNLNLDTEITYEHTILITDTLSKNIGKLVRTQEDKGEDISYSISKVFLGPATKAIGKMQSSTGAAVPLKTNKVTLSFSRA